MARIRTIKPEFWTSEQVAECSASARLLFVGLWTFSDDAGRHSASARRLKMEVFPADNFTSDQVQGWMDELIAVSLVRQYEAQGEKYWEVTGWKKHQKIDRPTYRHPGPDGELSPPSPHAIVEQSANDRRNVGEPSPPESNGVESNGVESNDEASRDDHIDSLLSKEIDKFTSKEPGVDCEDAGGWEADEAGEGGGNEEFTPEEVEEIRATANRKFRRRGFEMARRTPADRELLYKLAALLVTKRLPEFALDDALEAIKRHNGTVQNPIAYMQHVIRQWLCENNKPHSLNHLLATVHLPDELRILPQQSHQNNDHAGTVPAAQS